MGTLHLLDYAKESGIKNFVFASSSSVYGKNPDVPWKEDFSDLQPISPYAASKIAGEDLGKVYAHLYDLNFKALRLFTVYGARQRPDLAIHKFARLMRESMPIPLFGDGSTYRDYTHVSDIVKGIIAAIKYNATSFEIFNIGSGNPVTLLELVRGLENVMGKEAVIDFQPKQAGDVDRTYADINKAAAFLGYRPAMNLEAGLKDFWDWWVQRN
jgi:UDP-glucuronate 4-epimerase